MLKMFNHLIIALIQSKQAIVTTAEMLLIQTFVLTAEDVLSAQIVKG